MVTIDFQHVWHWVSFTSEHCSFAPLEFWSMDADTGKIWYKNGDTTKSLKVGHEEAKVLCVYLFVCLYI